MPKVKSLSSKANKFPGALTPNGKPSTATKRRPFAQRTPYGSEYPWKQWFKVKCFILLPGQDFYTTPNNMRLCCYLAARRHDKRVRITETTYKGKHVLQVEVLGKRRTA